MTYLNSLPSVDSFFGVDLKTGSMIIAALGLVHPMSYGCSFFIPTSYLLVTIWLLVALYFAASVVLLIGVTKSDAFLCSIWIWSAIVFMVVMVLMLMILLVVFNARKQRIRVFVVLLGMLWYFMTFYFILVVNTHRKSIEGKT